MSRDLDEKLIWLEALQVDAGSRKTIYEFEGNVFFLHTSGWMQTEDDGVIFFNCVVGGVVDGTPDRYLIDYELTTKQIQPQDIDWRLM